jgi:hypothetical protein
MNGSLLAVKLDGDELYTSIEVSEIEGTALLTMDSIEAARACS